VVPTERVLLRTGQHGPIGGDVSRQPALGGTVATLAADAVRGGEARMMPLRTPFGMHVTAQAKRILVSVLAAAVGHDAARLLIEENLIRAGMWVACDPGLMGAAPVSLGIIAAVARGGGARAGTDILECRLRLRQNFRAARRGLGARRVSVPRDQREPDEEKRKHAREQ